MFQAAARFVCCKQPFARTSAADFFFFLWRGGRIGAVFFRQISISGKTSRFLVLIQLLISAGQVVEVAATARRKEEEEEEEESPGCHGNSERVNFCQVPRACCIRMPPSVLCVCVCENGALIWQRYNPSSVCLSLHQQCDSFILSFFLFLSLFLFLGLSIIPSSSSERCSRSLQGLGGKRKERESFPASRRESGPVLRWRRPKLCVVAFSPDVDQSGAEAVGVGVRGRGRGGAQIGKPGGGVLGVATLGVANVASSWTRRGPPHHHHLHFQPMSRSIHQ